MSEPPRVLALAGSARRASYNRRLLPLLAEGVRSEGLGCTVLDAADFPLPLYDADLEAERGLPEAAVRLREIFAAHAGLAIASPEYNSFITPLLKNTLDWVTRAPGGRADLSGLRGKVVGLVAASPGPLGGLRGLAVVRMLLANLGCVVLPEQVTIRNAATAFGEDGALEEGHAARVRAVGAGVAAWVKRAHPG